MLSKESRKEAINKCKERKPLLGVFAVRCTISGRVWVGASRNLAATKNGFWFCLRSKSHQDRSLQEEWNAYGEPAFEYEILDGIDEDTPLLLITDLLKEKRKSWAAQLGASALT